MLVLLTHVLRLYYILNGSYERIRVHVKYLSATYVKNIYIFDFVYFSIRSDVIRH